MMPTLHNESCTPLQYMILSYTELFIIKLKIKYYGGKRIIRGY